MSNGETKRDGPKKMRLELLLILVGLFGCGTIYPIDPTSGPYAHMQGPILPEARVNGPILEHVRVAGWSTFSGGSSAAAAACSGGACAAAAAVSRASATSISFEHYQSADVQDFLQKLLEDTGTITKVYDSAEWEIKGMGGAGSLNFDLPMVYSGIVAIGQMAWAGIPLWERADANVELRLYHRHEFIRDYTGYGRCTAVGTIYYYFWKGITAANAGGPLSACASAASIADAVKRIQDDPPSDGDRLRQ